MMKQTIHNTESARRGNVKLFLAVAALLMTALAVPVLSQDAPFVVTVANATATSGLSADPCVALPDRITATGAVTSERGGSADFQWGIFLDAACRIPATGAVLPSGKVKLKKDVAVAVAPLDVTLGGHLGHQVYYVKLTASTKKGDTATGVSPTPAVPNLPPTVFDIRWNRDAGDICAEVTDTPDAASHNTRVSLVATDIGADLEDGGPAGVSLSLTGAACDPDGDAVTMTATVDLTAIVLSVGAGGAPGLQTAKLVIPVGSLDDPPPGLTHSVTLSIDDGFGGSDSSNTATIVDPREELRQEIAALGYSIPGFQVAITDVLEPAQQAFEARPIPIIVETQDLVNNETGLPPGDGVPDVDGNGDVIIVSSGPKYTIIGGLPLIRRDAWVEEPGALLSAEEARGEYFTLELNRAAGLLFDEESVNLARPMDAGIPTIYLPPEQQGPTLEFCFPRFGVSDGTGVPDFREFNLSDQLFLGDQAVPLLFDGTLASLDPGFIAASNADRLERLFQNLADTGRLFNAQTAWIQPRGETQFVFRQDGDGDSFHCPLVPRVRVQAAVIDGTTTPIVCWTFSDASCNHSQEAYRVTATKAGGSTKKANAKSSANSQSLSSLLTAGSGVYDVTVTTFDFPANPGTDAARGSSRTVRILVP